MSATAMLAFFAMAGAAIDDPAAHVAPELAQARSEIVALCVLQGRSEAECVCGARIAEQELDPRVFLLVPKLTPFLAEENTLVAVAGVANVVEDAGLKLSDGIAAYNAVKANEERVKQECAAPAQNANPE